MKNFTLSFPEKHQKNVYIGSAIACALVLLIIVGFAFSSGSGKNDNDTVSSTESVENTQK